jgi:hypothetical protein
MLTLKYILLIKIKLYVLPRLHLLIAEARVQSQGSPFWISFANNDSGAIFVPIEFWFVS